MLRYDKSDIARGKFGIHVYKTKLYKFNHMGLKTNIIIHKNKFSILKATKPN